MAWRGCLLFVACSMPWTAWGGGSEAPATEVASSEASTAEAPPDAQVAQADAGPEPALDAEALPEARTVVTASRSPERLEDSAVATEVITRSDILASGARDASELLAAHPGLQVVQTFAGATVQLQGLSPEYVLVLVDGERVAGRVAGSVDLSRLSTEDIEQVEVVKGPSSVLYGSDAVAGVVNLITRRARRPAGRRAARLLRLHAAAGAGRHRRGEGRELGAASERRSGAAGRVPPGPDEHRHHGQQPGWHRRVRGR